MMKDFWENLGAGIAIFLIAIGIGGCCYLIDLGTVAKEKVKAEHQK